MNNSQPHFHSPIKISSIFNNEHYGQTLEGAKQVSSVLIFPEKYQTQITQILEMKKKGYLHQALIKINELIERYPSRLRSYQIKGEICFIFHKYQQAVICYNQLLQEDEQVQNSIQIRVKLCEKTEKTSKSLYFYNRGLCLQKIGKHKEAIQSFKSAIYSNKYKFQPYLSLAESYNCIGKSNKSIQIIQKIIEKTGKTGLEIGNSIKIMDFLARLKEYQTIIKLIDNIKSQNKHKLQKSKLVQILSFEADALRKLKRYESSIKVYEEVLEFTQKNDFMVHCLYNLAFCYQKCSNINSQIACYKKILKIDQNNFAAVNNISNLMLRVQKYEQALQIINKFMNYGAFSQQSNDVNLLLLKSHRIIAYAKLQMCAELKKDLNDINQSISFINFTNQDQEKCQNYCFVKGVVQKYSKTFEKLSQVQKEASNPQISIKYSSQMKDISLKLMSSISCQLQSKVGDQSEQLEKLSQRINNLYRQIIEFKTSTLKQQQKSHLRIHNKIQQFQQILQKKQEQTNKLAAQMEQLKRQYSDVYQLVEEIKLSNKTSQLATFINQLKQAGKQFKAQYIQEFYWVFTAYIISIRLVSNHLVTKGKDLIHTNSISSFFSRFQSIFQTASKLPHIGILCSAINSLISLYLGSESGQVYHILNRLITKTFTDEKQLQIQLQKGIQNLAKTQYIQKIIQKTKQDKIRSEMSLYNRAYEWFRREKSKAIRKIMTLNCKDATQIQAIIKDQVVQDIGAILLFIIRNHQQLKTDQWPFFDYVFIKALLENFKNGQITSLYQKHQQKQDELLKQRERGCSNRCQIY